MIQNFGPLAYVWISLILVITLVHKAPASLNSFHHHLRSKAMFLVCKSTIPQPLDNAVVFQLTKEIPLPILLFLPYINDLRILSILFKTH